MNKISIFILSFIILFQSLSFDLEDLGKISTFVDHISCHYDNGDTFTDFIDIHYGTKLGNHENEHKEHNELPFKHQHLESHFQFAFVLNFHQYPIKSLDDIIESNNYIYIESHSKLVIKNVFQPPKVI